MWLPSRNAFLAGPVLFSIATANAADRDAAEDQAVEAIVALGGVVGWHQKHDDLPVIDSTRGNGGLP
ncbi:MAG TPA: hypothetical protein VGX78_08340 [Pirellulales bacterium]|jgi:hypothetical protein|nr:hypothetical protein [Pirellulales bacterium]